MPSVLPFTSNKVLCCIRNPLDVIQSLACFSNTMNHSIKPDFDFETAYPEWWDWFVHKQVDVMRLYFDTMIKHCTEDGLNPIHFVRYEDLVVDIGEPTKKVMAYLLEIEDITGTNAERRINEHVAKGKEANTTYKKKGTTGVPNAHAHRYTHAQIAYIKQELGHLLYLFGYANHPTENNPSTYFHFSDAELKERPELLKNYYGFKKINEISQKRVTGTDGKPKKVH